MPPLIEIQKRLRDAVIASDAAGLASLLTGGCDTEKRLAVHQRHYETSLVNALLSKFPAAAWLIGTPFVTEAARRFVHEHPPSAPCIAEYAEGFPDFLAESPAAARLPYLGAFAELEWHIGHAAIAVDQPPVTLKDFSKIAADELPETILRLQNGLSYLQGSWPIDELMKLYLMEAAPDCFEFEPADVWIEVRGARGEFEVNRLDASEFLFRKTILEGRSIGDAAEHALDLDAAFDPGKALTALIATGLITAVKRSRREDEP